MLIYITLFGGAAFGILIAYLIIIERELREKSRRLTELESKPGSSLEVVEEEQDEQWNSIEGKSEDIAQVAPERGADGIRVEKVVEGARGDEQESAEDPYRLLKREHGARRQSPAEPQEPGGGGGHL